MFKKIKRSEIIMTFPGVLLSGTVVSGANAAGSSSGGTSPLTMILLYVVIIFAVFYFISVKPQKKREKAENEMRESIKVGDSVLLSNGLFGKIADITAECYIIEFGTNKGVKVPVLKQYVYAIKEPNLTNKADEEPAEEKKSLFGGLKKKKDEE